MTARLTIDQVRVGMKVVCVDEPHWEEHTILKAGAFYTIEGLSLCGEVFLEGVGPSYRVERFVLAHDIPAPALPALTAELVEALREWHADIGSLRDLEYVSEQALYDAIERAGILAPPAPEQEDADQPYDAWWFA